MSTSDWILIALEGLVVIGFIALGVRSGGIGLGLWGGASHASSPAFTAASCR